MSFTDLPPEVLDNIFRSVARDDVHDLCSLSRCSLQFHEIVEPMLYYKFDSGQGKYMAFLKTILRNPHLARHVTEVVASQPKERYIRTLPRIPDDSRADIWKAILAACPEKDGKIRARCWFSAINRYGAWDEIMSLILIHLPRLKHIKLGIRCLYPFPIIQDGQVKLGRGRSRFEMLQRVCQLSGESPICLTSLNDVEIRSVDSLTAFLPTKVLMLFLQLKSVVNLSAYNVKWMCRRHDPILIPISSQARSLELHNCYLAGRDLDNLMQCFTCFTCLESFSFDGHRFYVPKKHCLDTWAPLLRHSSSTLRELRLTDANYYGFPIGDSWTENFPCFTSLEVLDTMDERDTVAEQVTRTSGRTLFAKLPPTVRDLTLRNCKKSSIDRIRIFLGDTEKTPALRTISLHFRDKQHLPFTGAEKERLIKEGLDRGISIQVHPNSSAAKGGI